MVSIIIELDDSEDKYSEFVAVGSKPVLDVTVIDSVGLVEDSSMFEVIGVSSVEELTSDVSTVSIVIA